MRLLHRQEELDDSVGTGIMFSSAEKQAVFLETITRISSRSWELSSRGEDGFGCISRNWIRLNFHLRFPGGDGKGWLLG